MSHEDALLYAEAGMSASQVSSGSRSSTLVQCSYESDEAGLFGSQVGVGSSPADSTKRIRCRDDDTLDDVYPAMLVRRGCVFNNNSARDVPVRSLLRA